MKIRRIIEATLAGNWCGSCGGYVNLPDPPRKHEAEFRQGAADCEASLRRAQQAIAVGV